MMTITSHDGYHDMILANPVSNQKHKVLCRAID